MSSRALNGMASIPCNQFICWRRSIGDKIRSLRSDLSRRPLFSGLLQKKRNLRRTKTPAVLFGLSLKLSALDVNGAGTSISRRVIEETSRGISGSLR